MCLRSPLLNARRFSVCLVQGLCPYTLSYVDHRIANTVIIIKGNPVYLLIIKIAEIILQIGNKNKPVRIIKLNYAVLIEKFPINIFNGKKLFFNNGYIINVNGYNVIYNNNN